MGRSFKRYPQSDIKPMFAIVDCNNFYASCERVFAPSLRGKPIIILSNNDGCVIARSNESKALGIAMGEPYFKCKELIEKHGVIAFSSNYTLYGDMSDRVMQTLEQFSPEIEVYSIDEAFLNMDGFTCDLTEYGRKIRNTVKQWTGIPVGIGMAHTKTLAKIANRIAKKSLKADGVLVLDNQKYIDKALSITEVGDVWGIGRRYAKFLNEVGVYTALQLRDKPDSWVRKNLTVVGLRTVHELRGIQSIPLELSPAAKKGITVSRAFGKKLKDKDQIKQALISHVTRAGEKLRGEGLIAGKMLVFMHTSPFAQWKPQYGGSSDLAMRYPTDYTPDLIHTAITGLDKIFRPGFEYAKCGIMLTEIQDKEKYQRDLFDSRNLQQQDMLMRSLDRINYRMGRNKCFYAGAGIRPKWKPAANLLSQHYTTDWNELLNITL